MKSTDLFLAALLFSFVSLPAEEGTLRIAVLQIDATPPIGSPLCNGAVKPDAMKQLLGVTP